MENLLNYNLIMKKRLIRLHYLTLFLFVPTTFISLSASGCSVNEDYLSDSVSFTTYDNSVKMAPDNDIIIGFNDYNQTIGKKQEEIKVVAKCNKKTIQNFTFSPLDTNRYPYFAKSDDVYDYSKNTVTTTYTFNTHAAVLE
jgi:hypothetical protein